MAAAKKLCSLANVKFVEDLDVVEVLNKSSVGKEILKSYRRSSDADINPEENNETLPELSERQRTKIVDLVIQEILNNTVIIIALTTL